jgi:hypothetical protein
MNAPDVCGTAFRVAKIEMLELDVFYTVYTNLEVLDVVAGSFVGDQVECNLDRVPAEDPVELFPLA